METQRKKTGTALVSWSLYFSGDRQAGNKQGKSNVIRWRCEAEVEEENKIGGQGRILAFDKRP